MNRDKLLTEMSIEVTEGEFHDTHDAAHQAEELLKQGVKNLSVPELEDALQKLNAGQRLTDAETGPDAWCASNYRDSIALVETELRKRIQEEFNAHNEQYATYIDDLKSEWLAENRIRSNGFGSDCYETMNPTQREEVHNRINQWERYITPLAEAWWKERGYGIIWPDDNAQPMKLYKLDTIEEEEDKEVTYA